MHWNDFKGEGASPAVFYCILLLKCNYREAASSEKPNESAVIIYWLMPRYSTAFLLPKFGLETTLGCESQRPSQTSLERLRLEWRYFLDKLG